MPVQAGLKNKINHSFTWQAFICLGLFFLNKKYF